MCSFSLLNAHTSTSTLDSPVQRARAGARCGRAEVGRGSSRGEVAPDALLCSECTALLVAPVSALAISRRLRVVRSVPAAAHCRRLEKGPEEHKSETPQTLTTHESNMYGQ